MKEPHIEGPATHDDPESCGDDREVGIEALTGARTGSVLSREIKVIQGADAVKRSGRQHELRRHREAQLDPARSETRGTHGTFLHENREIPMPPTDDGAVGRPGKAKGRSLGWTGWGSRTSPWYR